MEGSDAKTDSAVARLAHPAKTATVLDVLRFVFGLVFVVMGVGLLLEAVLVAGGSHYLYLEGVNRAFEFYVGVMSVALGGLLFGRMSQRSGQN